MPVNPFFPALMPAVDFKGADAGVTWTDLSPRVSVTYDLTGDGENVVSSSSATYYGQMSPGQLSNQLAATSAVFVRYPWADTNGDAFVQANEVNTTVPFLSKSTADDPGNPTSTTAPTRVEPNVKNDRSREFIVGFDRQLAAQMAVGGSHIWRKYDQFLWTDRDNFTSANYVAVPFQPNVLIPSPNLSTNQPERYRDFNGFKLTFQKRPSNNWSMNASYAYEGPTNIDKLNGFQYAPESGGSGSGGIFTNAKWLVKVNGRYTAPWGINLAANYQARQGFPYLQTILSPARANGAGQVQAQLDPLGELRLGNANQISGIIASRVARFGINVRW